MTFILLSLAVIAVNAAGSEISDSGLNQLADPSFPAPSLSNHDTPFANPAHQAGMIAPKLLDTADSQVPPLKRPRMLSGVDLSLLNARSIGSQNLPSFPSPLRSDRVNSDEIPHIPLSPEPSFGPIQNTNSNPRSSLPPMRQVMDSNRLTVNERSQSPVASKMSAVSSGGKTINRISPVRSGSVTSQRPPNLNSQSSNIFADTDLPVLSSPRRANSLSHSAFSDSLLPSMSQLIDKSQEQQKPRLRFKAKTVSRQQQAPGGNSNRYSKEELSFIKQARKEGKTYGEISALIREKFGKRRSADALKKQFAMVRPEKSDMSRRRYTPEENAFIKQTYAQTKSWRQTAKLFNAEFPHRQRTSNAIQLHYTLFLRDTA